MEDSNDLASKLPPEIQTALKRKSSRDPNSRFPRKLHMLLSYLATDPKLEEEIGLSWISDTEFKMNKKNVSQVMGIKLNTMNVNLRDLGFEQLQHDKGGWTQWKRPGFTRTSVFPDTQEPVIQQGCPPNLITPVGLIPAQIPAKLKPQKKQFIDTCTNLTIEKVTPNEEFQFRQIVDQIWAKLSNLPEIDCNTFIRNAAEFFKQPEQPLENAIDVIKAIIAPNERPLNKSDLFKFLAMFGPSNTAMLKIASLLLCSNNNGNWLVFDPTTVQTMSGYQGSFSPSSPNCLIFRSPDGTVRRFWNHPMIDAYGVYLICENGAKYSSWDKVFAPLTNQYPDMGYSGF